MNGIEEVYVLLVESKPEKVSLICGLLDRAPGCSFKVETASTLTRAIYMMTENSYDAVLVEMFLPDSNGLATVRQVASRFQEVAIIILNGGNSNQLHSKPFPYWAHAYLDTKFLSARHLASTIDHAIERRKNNNREERLLADLTSALEKIEMLREMLPLCAGCSKVRQKNGEWHNYHR